MRSFAISYNGVQPTFKTFQTPNGTFPSATGPNDIITFTGTGVTITGNSATKTINFTVSGSSFVGGSDTQVQFNDGGSFGGDSAFTYNKTSDVLSVKGIAMVPNAAGGIIISAPAAFNGPVFEVKSDGGQVAYVADTGFCLFAGGTVSGTLQVNALGGYTGPFNLNSAIFPNADNAIDLGTSSGPYYFRSIYAYSILGLSSIQGGSIETSTALRVNGTSAYLGWSNNDHIVRWHIDGAAGSDQDWYLPANAPGPGQAGVWVIGGDGVISFSTLSGSSGDYYGGDNAFHAFPSAPDLASVLSTGPSANADIIDLHGLQWSTDNTYTIGSLTYAPAQIFTYVAVTNSVQPLHGTDITLGSGNADYVNFLAGSGASAGNTDGIGTPTAVYGQGNATICGDPDAWLAVKLNGTEYRIPCFLPGA